jgi:N-acetyl-gamma-glutamyl-phosphate/LysW-gamma-L-alpha-aminoadipyl-6-phosphate reductase
MDGEDGSDSLFRPLVKVAVIGAAGYAGGELLRLLLQHPEISECIATSRSQAGKPIADVHPALGGLSDARFSGATAAEVSRGRDVVFLCLEHGESSKVAGDVFAAGPGLVVDLAADFRVQDPSLYERFYGAHTAPELVSRFTYGLADVRGSELRGAPAIAAPGCFATAAQLALYPLARAGIDVTASLFGITGSSGAGVHPLPTTHHPMRAHNVFAYSPLGHRHEAEVLQMWREWNGRPDATCRLMTHSGPFVRGIYLTLHAYLPHIRGKSGSDHATVAACYEDVFRNRPFVRVLAAPPELTHAVGTNFALIHALESADGREIQVSIAIDNLIKGAGGQAIQAMNLALGLDERAGLMAAGIYPC